MESHKLANIFPLMQDSEIEELAKDIKINGLEESIVTFEGKILDGRNRFLACEKAGVQPEFYEYAGSDPLAYVISLNLHRRHLTVSQRAAIAVELLPEIESQAKLSQIRKPVDSVCPKSDTQNIKIRSDKKAGDLLNVGRSAVADVKKIKAENPEKFEQIKAGKITIQDVKNEIKKDKIAKIRKQVNDNIKTPESIDGKYDIIYIDPPWQYDNKVPSRAIENHYPTMSMDELINIDIPAKDDCVLFMWVTVPFLDTGIDLLRKWNFTYKTCCIWDKEIIGLGYWFRNQHEILLVGIKGDVSPPMPENRHPSVYQEKRGKHSKKPDYYYEIIENMFPHKSKIEMFARDKRQNWAVWGNQV